MSLTEKQLAMRRSGITATDVRVLSGLDPYGRTAHDVWSSKVLHVDDFVATEETELGSELEPILIPRLARKVGLHALRIDPEKLTMRHPRNERHIATPDALLSQSAFHEAEATAQIKVCGLHTAGAWGHPRDGVEAIPEYVLVQCAWEMYVAIKPVCYVGALIGTEVRAYRVELTPDVAELVEALQGVADRFWMDHVVTKRSPRIDGTEGSGRMLRSLFPRSRGNMLRAGAEVEALARDYFAAKRVYDDAERSLETTKQLLQEACGDADGFTGDGWRLRYTLHDAYEVTPIPYVVPAGRRFDMRAKRAKSGSGKAA